MFRLVSKIYNSSPLPIKILFIIMGSWAVALTLAAIVGNFTHLRSFDSEESSIRSCIIFEAIILFIYTFVYDKSYKLYKKTNLEEVSKLNILSKLMLKLKLNRKNIIYTIILFILSIVFSQQLFQVVTYTYVGFIFFGGLYFILNAINEANTIHVYIDRD